MFRVGGRQQDRRVYHLTKLRKEYLRRIVCRRDEDITDPFIDTIADGDVDHAVIELHHGVVIMGRVRASTRVIASRAVSDGIVMIQNDRLRIREHEGDHRYRKRRRDAKLDSWYDRVEEWMISIVPEESLEHTDQEIVVSSCASLVTAGLFDIRDGTGDAGTVCFGRSFIRLLAGSCPLFESVEAVEIVETHRMVRGEELRGKVGTIKRPDFLKCEYHTHEGKFCNMS